MTFLEYPVSDWSGIAKARLSVRIHLSTRRSSVPDRHDAYGAVLTAPGGTVHVLADTSPIRTGSDPSRHFTCLHLVMNDWVQVVQGRHVDVITSNPAVLTVFQRHARGGRTGRREVDDVLAEMAGFCCEHRVTLTIRMQPAVADEEEAVFRMLADQLANDQCSSPLRRRERSVSGLSWRSDLAIVVRDLFASRFNPPTERKSVVARDLDISVSEINRRLEGAKVYGDTGGIVRFVPYFAHVMKGLSDPPHGRGEIRIRVGVPGGVCVMTWGPHGWTASAWPGDVDEGDGGPDVVTCEADIARTAGEADPLLSPWMQDCRSLLDAARIVASGAVACGRRLGCHGRPWDLCGWIETIGRSDAGPVLVFSDMSLSMGGASGNDGLIGVGYVVIGPHEAMAGYSPFPFDGTTDRKSAFESFASAYALAQAPRTAGGRRRYVLVTDCMQWFTNVSRVLAGRPDTLPESTALNVLKFLDDGRNVVDILWLKGHSNSLDPLSVGNSFCDRLAGVARKGRRRGEHLHSTDDWISSVFQDVALLEDATGEYPLPANLDTVMIADMLGRDLEEVRAMVREHIDLQGRYASIPWDEVVALPASVLYGADPTRD